MTFVTAKNSVPAEVLVRWPSWPLKLDPRHSLGAATAWLIAALSLSLALAASTWVSTVASDALLRLKYRQLDQYAERLSGQLDIALYGYLQSVRATAVILGAIPAPSDRKLRESLGDLQRALPQFAWAGYVDAAGRVAAATGGILEGRSVADRAWFPQGLKGPFISDLRKAPMQPDALRAAAPTATRYVALAAPIVDPAGETIGVVGVQMAWNWADRLKRKLDAESHSPDAVETFVVDRDNVVLLGPAHSVGHVWPDTGTHSEYIEGSYTAKRMESSGPRWTVWVREPKLRAFAGVARLRIEIFSILFSLGLVAAAVGAWAAGRVLRRIGLVAELADSVRSHDGPASAERRDEAARIGDTLAGLVAELQKDKAELQTLNSELDARVAARTREVERLSEDNQYAAVIRERLRIARALHDTLAHSMMATLTQLRLLRKFVDTNPERLKEELDRALEAAQIGLNEARDAIVQMRYNPVRDAGLDSAVSALAKRFEQRTGIPVTYASDLDVATLADSRAETVFRMIEELLHNVERHAEAHEVHVTLCLRHEGAGGTLLVTVRDDGVGFDPELPAAGHYGLRGLREQAILIGAALLIESAAEQGVTAVITLPVFETEATGRDRGHSGR